MSPVEMQAIQGSLILRARGSELLILAHHVSELKSLKQPKDFTRYFMNDALINRPARKLFEAWLRKDGSLWQRLYTKIQKEMEVEEADTTAKKAPVVAKEISKPEKKASAEAPQAKAAKAPAKPAVKAEPEAKKEPKEAAKKAAVKEPKEEKKSASAAKAKPAAKEKAEKPTATKKVAAAKKTTTAAKKKTTAAKSSAAKTTKKKK